MRRRPMEVMTCGRCRWWNDGRCVIDRSAQKIGHVCTRPGDFRSWRARGVR